MELINSSCEPMDIDLSSNSISAMDISYNENSIKTEYTETKSYIITKNQKDTTNFKKLVVHLHVLHKKSRTKKKFLYYLGIFFVLLSGIYYHSIMNFQCCERIDTELVRHKLLVRLYGQNTAASQIIETLESDVKTKILIIYGGTGVGKTLAVSIILENIINQSNVYHYTMPSFIDNISSSILFGLTWCQSSIIIVDDLMNDDVFAIKKSIETLVMRSEDLNRNLTIILIYNCDVIDAHFSSKCDNNFPSKLNHNFSDIAVTKQFIKFSQLDNNVLRKCVEYELNSVKVEEEHMQYILKNFDVARDGCKGVHKKIKYLNIN